MISKMLISLVFVALIASAGGFIVLSMWNVPVAQQEVQKTVDAAKLMR